MLGDLLAGNDVRVSRTTPDFSSPARPGAAPLADKRVSREPIRLSHLSDGGVLLSLDQSRTSVVFRGETIRSATGFSADEVRRGVVLEFGRRVVLLLHHVAASIPPAPAIEGLAGESDGIRRVRAAILRVADLDLPVLIRGETGTGKEAVASAVHRASTRSAAPFVPVNLGAIPPTLASSELFGAGRGAFTGAVRAQPGYFNAARGGTLFLDEIGEAPSDVQVMLLRVLETGEIQTPGEQSARIKADVRVIAATDANLETKIAQGSFRAPLLHRLAGYEIAIPPLRERRDDIGRLFLRFFLEELDRFGERDRLIDTAAAAEPWLPPSLVARLVELDWPGNVRQLRNVVRRLVIDGRGSSRIEAGPLLEGLLHERERDSMPSPGAVASPEPLVSGRRSAEVTEVELLQALRESRWDLVATARRLGIARSSLYVLIERSTDVQSARSLTTEEISRCHAEHGGDLERMADALQVSKKALSRRLRETGLG